MKFTSVFAITTLFASATSAHIFEDLESASDDDMMVLDARRRPGFAAYNRLEQDYMTCMKVNGCDHKKLTCQRMCHYTIRQRGDEVAKARLEAAKIEKASKIVMLI